MTVKTVSQILKARYDAEDYYGQSIKMSTDICSVCDGDGVVFFLTVEENHYTKITASSTLSDWLQYTVYGTNDYESRIQCVCERFDCTWDFDKKELFISFRRNEYTLAQAFFRLQQCAYILSSLA